MNLCIICLRTKLLKLANNTLQEFYDELCDVSISTMTTTNYFCNECEYLLIKTYKFKEKCVKALKIYQKWMVENSKKKQSVNVLYTLLPPSALGIWTASSTRIANFAIKAADFHTTEFIEVELIKDKYTKQVKMEYVQNDNNDNIDIYKDVIKNERISKRDPKSKQNHLDDVKNYIDDLKNNSETEENQFYEKLDEISGVNEINDKTPVNVKRETEVSNFMTNFLTKTQPSKNIKANVKECIKGNVSKSKKVKTSTVKKKIIVKEKLPKIKKPSKKIRALFEKMKEKNKIYESVFDIQYLSTQEMKLEEFQKRKTYDCYVKAEHKCEICFQIFNSSNYLKYHTEKYHTESPGSVLCAICQTWRSKRGNHNSTHSVVFKCKLCHLVTYHRESMQKHYEWHNGKVYHCEECNVSYKSASVYRSHMGRVHRRGRNVCDACGRGFRSPLGLKIHKKSSSRCTVHTETAEGVRCDECDVTLPSQEVYETHVSDVHKLRLCKESATGVPQPRFVRRTTKPWKKRRTKPFQLTCRVCSTGLLGWSQLQLHFKKEHPADDMSVLYADKSKHLCDICGVGFSQQYSLRDHMNKHTGERPFACDLCPKRFRSSYYRNEHRLRHFPSTISCTHCGKRFKTKGNLYFHLKTHTGEKDHKCDICGKGFIQRNNLNQHIRGVHYNIRRKRGGTERGEAEEEENRAGEENNDDFVNHSE